MEQHFNCFASCRFSLVIATNQGSIVISIESIIISINTFIIKTPLEGVTKAKGPMKGILVATCWVISYWLIFISANSCVIV